MNSAYYVGIHHDARENRYRVEYAEVFGPMDNRNYRILPVPQSAKPAEGISFGTRGEAQIIAEIVAKKLGATLVSGDWVSYLSRY